jgi:hypothetical protein
MSKVRKTVHKTAHKAVHKVIAAVMAVLVMLVAVAQPASAAPAEQGIGLGCDNGVCRFELDLGSAADLLPAGVEGWLEFLEPGLRQLPGDVRLAVQDDVLLSLPVGTITLPDADLMVEMGENGKIASVRGTAALPLPTLGLFNDIEWVTPARVQVGYDVGANLPATDVPVAADHHYLFIDAEAGLQAISPEGVELSVPAGQQFTLMVDLTQPLVYLDGDVNLRYMGDLAFVRELVDPTGGLEWLPTDILMPHALNLSVTGTLGQGVDPNLTLEAGYRMDGGLIGRWLALEEPLIEAQGQVVLAPEGLLLAGQASSALAPESVLDSQMTAQLFIPFDPAQRAYAQVGGALQAPFAGIDRSGEVQLGAVTAEPSELPEAESAVAETPTVETPTVETNAEAAPAVVGVAVDNRWVDAAAAALQGAAASAATIAEAAQAGYGQVAEGAGQGVQWAAGHWCALTNRCAAPVQEGVSVAQADTE